MSEMNGRVKEAFKESLANLQYLALPGMEAEGFVLETDWSGDYAGYMLFLKDGDDNLHLVDIGSKVGLKAASSYLGELDTIIWACKRTKSYRGDIPLVIRTDNHGILDKSRSRDFYESDLRSFRRWSWLVSNEV